MYVTRVPNRSSPPAILLRESYRDGGKVKSRTLANLTHWPEAKVEALRRVLKGETYFATPYEQMRIERSRMVMSPPCSAWRASSGSTGCCPVHQGDWLIWLSP